MRNPIPAFEPDQKVQVRWEGDRWIDAHIRKVYDNGADCICGTRGCFYVQFPDIREVKS